MHLSIAQLYNVTSEAMKVEVFLKRLGVAETSSTMNQKAQGIRIQHVARIGKLALEWTVTISEDVPGKEGSIASELLETCGPEVAVAAAIYLGPLDARSTADDDGSLDFDEEDDEDDDESDEAEEDVDGDEGPDLNHAFLAVSLSLVGPGEDKSKLLTSLFYSPLDRSWTVEHDLESLRKLMGQRTVEETISDVLSAKITRPDAFKYFESMARMLLAEQSPT